MIIAIFIVSLQVSINSETIRYVTGCNQIVKIKGTTNRGAWAIQATNFAGYLEADATLLSQTNKGEVSAKMEIRVPIKMIHACDAVSKNVAQVMGSYVRGEAFPTVDYKLTKLRVVKNVVGKLDCISTGVLCISGVTNDINFLVSLVTNTMQAMTITGKANLRLNAFNIKPSDMLCLGVVGSLIFTNDVVVDVKMVLSPKRQNR
jgi:hypothetical protein